MRKDHIYGWTILYEGKELGELRYTGGIDGFFRIFSVTRGSDFDAMVRICADPHRQCALIYRNNHTGQEVNGTFFCGAPYVEQQFYMRDLRPHDPRNEMPDPFEETIDINGTLLLFILIFLDAYVLCALFLMGHGAFIDGRTNAVPELFRQGSEVFAFLLTVAIGTLAYAMLPPRFRR